MLKRGNTVTPKSKQNLMPYDYKNWYWLKNRKNNILIMGVVNVTPDSFSDGGLYFKPRDA